MKNMETGVWSVNGTVTAKKTIKLHGLLSGEDFEFTMKPGTKPDTPLRGIVIKTKPGFAPMADVARRQAGRSGALQLVARGNHGRSEGTAI